MIDSGIGIVLGLIYAGVVALAIALVILLARLILAATKTLDTITEERRFRIDLLIAERGGELEL